MLVFPIMRTISSTTHELAFRVCVAFLRFHWAGFMWANSTSHVADRDLNCSPSAVLTSVACFAYLRTTSECMIGPRAGVILHSSICTSASVIGWRQLFILLISQTSLRLWLWGDKWRGSHCTLLHQLIPTGVLSTHLTKRGIYVVIQQYLCLKGKNGDWVLLSIVWIVFLNIC